MLSEIIKAALSHSEKVIYSAGENQIKLLRKLTFEHSHRNSIQKPKKRRRCSEHKQQMGTPHHSLGRGRAAILPGLHRGYNDIRGPKKVILYLVSIKRSSPIHVVQELLGRSKAFHSTGIRF